MISSSPFCCCCFFCFHPASGCVTLMDAFHGSRVIRAVAVRGKLFLRAIFSGRSLPPSLFLLFPPPNCVREPSSSAVRRFRGTNGAKRWERIARARARSTLILVDTLDVKRFSVFADTLIVRSADDDDMTTRVTLILAICLSPTRDDDDDDDGDTRALWQIPLGKLSAHR